MNSMPEQARRLRYIFCVNTRDPFMDDAVIGVASNMQKKIPVAKFLKLLADFLVAVRKDRLSGCNHQLPLPK